MWQHICFVYCSFVDKSYFAKSIEKKKCIEITRSFGYWKLILRYSNVEKIIARVHFLLSTNSIYPYLWMNYLIFVKEKPFHFIGIYTQMQVFKLVTSFWIGKKMWKLLFLLYGMLLPHSISVNKIQKENTNYCLEH